MQQEQVWWRIDEYKTFVVAMMMGRVGEAISGQEEGEGDDADEDQEEGEDDRPHAAGRRLLVNLADGHRRL